MGLVEWLIVAGDVLHLRLTRSNKPPKNPHGRNGGRCDTRIHYDTHETAARTNSAEIVVKTIDGYLCGGNLTPHTDKRER